ncbi:uncharacterized protein N0V89_003561 [Didymosphaeria variabile]|uniref:NADP-dependent oxidoreductase domain-containing protein n=1 Tax=Didymosphaeria variabile TaxID=1932322 RepID=A0A9W8XNM6_9PLEO|nr:uncharacterized protein N0V89_003561 [Didymosphaeria variabile]KAJ4355544.1 hypothetical protein N0V89_003561 [Didymosphaeria variabile]
MESNKRVQIVMGTANFGDPTSFWGQSDSNLLEAFDLLKKHGHNKLDCAQAYNGSESKLGALEAGITHGFLIDTKWRGGWAREKDANSTAGIVSAAKASLDRLKVPQVDIFYLHAPVYNTPIEETLAGVNAAYRAGNFRRFGVSNFPPEDVQQVYNVCKEKNYVLPTVYQGNYSAIARSSEERLLPLLRKLSIAFLAYSPIAGGFLTKDRAQIGSGETRFSPNQMYGLYHKMYVKDVLLDGLEDWERIATDEGISKAELAYRWVVYSSSLSAEEGDGIVIGASRLAQLEETLLFCDKGPLSQKAVEGINELWQKVKHEAPVDNYQSAKQ